MADTAVPRKKGEMLTSFSIILILLAVVAVLTIVLNGASYTINDEEGSVIAATLSDFMMSPVRGFADAIDVCLFVMVLGGFLGIVNKTNAIVDGIAVLVKKMGGNELSHPHSHGPLRPGRQLPRNERPSGLRAAVCDDDGCGLRLLTGAMMVLLVPASAAWPTVNPSPSALLPSLTVLSCPGHLHRPRSQLAARLVPPRVFVLQYAKR